MEVNHLPLILVSASDKAAASKIISDIIDNKSEPADCSGTLWTIQNKYYSVEVVVRAACDGTESPAPTALAAAGAHIIYLSEDECSDFVAAEQRYSTAAGVSQDAVRILAAAADGSDLDAVEAWARRRRYEVVPLLERGPPPLPDEPFPELYGVERLRASLHAYRWRTFTDQSPTDDGRSDEESSDGDGRESCDEEELECAVERAEQFAAAVRAARDATSSGDAASGGASREERLQRAECVVAALCRALGYDLDLDS